MSKFPPTNRLNDCPVCGDISGDCRSSADDANYFQCFTNSSARKFEIINGFKHIGTTKDGLWGQFILEVGKPQTSFEERKQLRQLKESLERQHNAAIMPVADRDRCYREVLSQLTLHEEDRADLLRRGFTDEQIVRYGFKSVSQWQPIRGDFPNNLPGRSKDGSSLDNWHEGYLCPITTADGKIQGFQIRNRHYSGKGAKYPWLSRNERRNPQGYQAHLQNQELPVGVYWPDKLRAFDTIALCEGFAIKPQAAANRLGTVVIACDSANFASRPNNFEQALKEAQKELCKRNTDSSSTVKDLAQLQLANSQATFAASSKLSTKLTPKDTASGSLKVGDLACKNGLHSTIQALKTPGLSSSTSILTGESTATSYGIRLLCIPDAGDIKNAQVMNRIGRQFNFLRELGLETEILWWGQLSKSHGDIDEVSYEQFEQAELISWSAFAAKADQRISALLPPTETRVEGQTKAEWLAQQRIKRDEQAYSQLTEMLSITADIDYDDEGYQKQGRAVLYRPLRQHLKYDTHGELINGFASEQTPSTEGRSLLAYDCSQGTGKSNNALIPAALRTASSGGRVLIFVPTRGLAKEFKGRINAKAGEPIAATHLDEKYYSAAIVVSCPESAYKFKGMSFDLIQIDEANEVLHRIESGELGNAGPQSLAAFRQLLASTKVVGIATAAMSGRTLSAVQTVGGFTLQETQLQKRSRPATKMRVIEYTNFHQWLQKIIDALRNGQRVAIPVGSQGKGRMIDRVLRALFPDKNGLVIDGAATLQNQRSRFLSDPDAFLTSEQPDWFIFTPVINSGVSIEGHHFDIQFEYTTSHEGAQSISQRGERIRLAIGRSGGITERHIYFSQKGAPTLEAYPEALSWQYWRDELANDADAPMGAAAALAKALGADKALHPMKQAIEKFAGMRPNLPHFLALKAFEVIFKRELLHEDWQRYGWTISPAAEPNAEETEQLTALKGQCDRIRIGLIEQQGRTLKKTRTRDAEGDIEEVNNPFQAARAAKLQLEKLLGKDYLSQQNDKFFTAWAADKSASNPGIRAVVRAQLLKLAVQDPECWQQIERMKALKFLASKPDTEHEPFYYLPELPAAARDIELTAILSRCPGVAEVVTGELTEWKNKDPQVIAAGLYLIAHQKQLAANTKKRGLLKGAQFTDQMAPTALFNKALDLMGYEPKKRKREGSGARLNLYRLATPADVTSALAKLKAKNSVEPMALFRAELKAIRAQSRASIDAAVRHQILGRAMCWVTEKTGGEVSKAIAAIRRRHADQMASEITNLGDVLKKDAFSSPDQGSWAALLEPERLPLPPPSS